MDLLLTYLKPYRWLLLLAIFLAIINQLFSLLDPQILRIAVDNYAYRAHELTPEEFRGGLLLLVGGIVGVAMVSRLAKTFQDYTVNVVIQSLGTQLYADGVEAVLRLPYQDFEDTASGSVLNQLQKARQDTQDLIAALINNVFVSFVTLTAVVSYATYVHWTIGLSFLAMFPVVGGFMAVLSRRIRKIQQEIFEQTAGLSGTTTESIRNIELVKALGLTGQEVNRLNNTNTEILALELRKVRTVRALSFVQGTLINLIRALLMGLMFWLIYQDQVTVGEFLSLMMYSFFVLGPLNELGNVITKAQEASASLKNYREIIARPPEVINEGGLQIGGIEQIEFKSVGYRYGSSKQPALSKLSFKMRSGQFIAFVGPSGAGKSTLVKLLLGLYRPTTGQIMVNGQPLSELDWEAWRSKLGLVPQTVELFAGTIKDNLLFVKQDASDEDCRTVLKQAQLEGLVKRAPLGLATPIGEGGFKLSGGERQRLAIARALLRDPAFLIFDEATSSLDSLTEMDIATTVAAVAQARPDLIMVQIAHRLSTISAADAIFVLERGQLVEQGTHANLLKQKGLYAALWREQSGS